MYVCATVHSCSILSYSLQSHVLSSLGSSLHGDSPGKNTGVGCHALLQGIFLTQVSNPDLPHYKQILYHLSHQGRPRILEWIAFPFPRGSSHPRDQTQVSRIAGRFITS